MKHQDESSYIPMLKERIFAVLFVLLGLASAASADEPVVQIVQNMTYHGDEIEGVENGGNWFGIVSKDGHFHVKTMRIGVKTVYDSVLDAEKGPFTGKEVTSDPDAVFLLRGLPLKSGTKIPFVAIEDTMLTDGKSVTLQAGLAEVTLQGVQDKQYRLTANIKGQTHMLVEHAYLDDTAPHVLWAGDVNGDGQADILIDTTHHYNVSNPSLFLSKVTDGVITYHKVAERESMGC